MIPQSIERRNGGVNTWNTHVHFSLVHTRSARPITADAVIQNIGHQESRPTASS